MWVRVVTVRIRVRLDVGVRVRVSKLLGSVHRTSTFLHDQLKNLPARRTRPFYEFRALFIIHCLVFTNFCIYLA